MDRVCILASSRIAAWAGLVEGRRTSTWRFHARHDVTAIRLFRLAAIHMRDVWVRSGQVREVVGYVLCNRGVKLPGRNFRVKLTPPFSRRPSTPWIALSTSIA